MSEKHNHKKPHGVINGAGEVVEQMISSTLAKNYMPYAMSVIMSRAIPEIDGFKPSHRKLLFTMYKMGLLGSARTKSANIVGQTMKLNPHGDSAIYDTMVRLSRGYEALLHPYVDSKGNFGKFYSRDMACAASRYTEARLDEICSELFGDIDKDTVDFVDNYDNTLKEPALLPCSFPSILVNANTGIAVGMASSICSFNLVEVCTTTIKLIKNPQHDISSTLLAPDFSGGGKLIYVKDIIEEIYRTGRGNVKVRSEYRYDKSANCIDIISIPPTTSCELIIDKIIDLVKKSRIKEISDIRDETGIEGLKITIDLKKNIDPDRLMLRLFKLTPLEDTFSCNFNVLINGIPQVISVKSLLNEWINFRISCIKRRTNFDICKKKDKLHLLRGLSEILADIDKAIAIIRNTALESDVVPNLMAGFLIDEIQANYVAEIKLRHLNREYILNRIKEIDRLDADIALLSGILSSDQKVGQIIIDELENVSKKYGKPRKSILVFPSDIVDDIVEEEVEDYSVYLFLTKEGYFKKITPQSLRMSSEQRLKDGDAVTQQIESSNSAELLFFTDHCQVYKTKAADFQDTKASVLGEYLSARLSLEDGESIVSMAAVKDYSGSVLFFFENGKIAKVSAKAYETKTNRKKLVNAFSNKSKAVFVCYSPNNSEYLLTSSSGKVLIFCSADIQEKTTKNTQGVTIMSLRGAQKIISAQHYTPGMLTDDKKYRAKNLPAVGTLPRPHELSSGQMTLLADE